MSAVEWKGNIMDTILTFLNSDVVLGYPDNTSSVGFLPSYLSGCLSTGYFNNSSFVLLLDLLPLFFFFLVLNTIFMFMTFKFVSLHQSFGLNCIFIYLICVFVSLLGFLIGISEFLCLK